MLLLKSARTFAVMKSVSSHSHVGYSVVPMNTLSTI